MNYPEVKDEFATMAALLTGKSIARFGDGELKMLDGAGYIREEPNKALTHELKQVMRRPLKNCLVAIPTMDRKGPKYASWARHKQRFAGFLRRTPKHHVFYSAFISRPDSAPWIRTREFALDFQKLWLGKRVVVVGEATCSAVRAARNGAASVEHVVCPRHGAYDYIDKMERAVVEAKPDIVLLSCGVTATCLAYRLARREIQAIDFGSSGRFILELLCSPS